MKKLSLYRRIFSLILCLSLFLSLSATALADDAADSFIDPDALQQLVDDFVEERGLNPDNFSIGYVYTATGEEWYYNPDTWYYPASMYKVPLMMVLAEKVAAGELQQDSDLGGYTVALAEEYIISYSNNDYAHYVRTYLGGDEAWRSHAKSYASLEDDDYHPDYMDYCYFSPRFITQVVNTLYTESERFPNIIESMLVARPTHDFRLSTHMNNTYKIAQKYGSYVDDLGDNWNHNTGIIYTPNPFILTVMTRNVSNYEKVISDVAVMLTEYTLSLDEKLEQYEQEQAAQAEAERIAAEKAAAEAEAQAKAEKEQAEAQKAEAQALAEAESKADARSRKLGLIAIVAAVLLLIVTVLTVVIRKHNKRKRYEEYKRRFEYEMRNRRDR